MQSINRSSILALTTAMLLFLICLTLRVLTPHPAPEFPRNPSAITGFPAKSP